MRRVMVRYRVKPDRAEENEALVRAVYEELRAAAPDDFHYATFRLEDGVTFVHLAAQGDGESALTGLDAFRRFQAGIRDRCEEPPVVAELDEIGSFNLFAS